jgi:hypothetical protein
VQQGDSYAECEPDELGTFDGRCLIDTFCDVDEDWPRGHECYTGFADLGHDPERKGVCAYRNTARRKEDLRQN